MKIRPRDTDIILRNTKVLLQVHGITLWSPVHDRTEQCYFITKRKYINLTRACVETE